MVTHPLWVQEVPGSIPSPGIFFIFLFLLCFYLLFNNTLFVTTFCISFCNVNYTPTTKCVCVCGGGVGLYWIRFVPSVCRSVRPSVRLHSITPLQMKGFPSNLNDTFTSTRGSAEPMLHMCQFKVKVTVKGQIFNKQILHIMSCPLYNSFTNGRISFKPE